MCKTQKHEYLDKGSENNVTTEIIVTLVATTVPTDYRRR